jgi:hypothetical protein
MAKRIGPGDVLEAVSPRGRIYLHYLGKHPKYGDAVAICPTIFPEPIRIEDALFRDGYVAFYPAAAAAVKGLVKVVGRLPPTPVPSRLRRFGAMSGTRVDTWIVEDGVTELVKRRLSDEELKLPLAGIWNHEYLLERVLEGWRPEQEGNGEGGPSVAENEVAPVSDDRQRPGNAPTDRDAIEELRRTSNTEEPHLVAHYLYFQRKDAAARTAVELRARGFRIEERLGADGVNWLVLARHDAIPTEKAIASVRKTLEQLAERLGGEYDGWEAEVK